MRSAFFGFHVATTGLQTARAAINVTSHNVANSEIPGYTRQVAQMKAARPLMLFDGKGMYGTGSQVTGIIQIRDRFLDRKYWTQSAIYGQYTAVNTYLNFVETVFNQMPDVGVLRTFNGFFSTLHDLTGRAHESTFRTNVTTNAHSLAEQIKQNAYALQRQQQDLNREFYDVVVTINSLGQQIANINEQIHIFERDGSNANDLRDQRALLIDQLSQYVNVQVEERDYSRPGMSNDRRLSVMINGNDFVDHTRLNILELVARDNPHDPRSGTQRNEMDVKGLYDIYFKLTDEPFDIYSSTLTGKLKGIVDVRDGNGGQVTAASIFSGQMLIQTQLDALSRTSDFINGLDTRLSALQANINTWVTMRNASFAALGGATNTAEAREYVNNLVQQQTRRNNLVASLPTLSATAVSSVGFATLRTQIENVFGGALSTPATLEARLDDVQTLLNSVTAVNASSAPLNVTAFENAFNALLVEMSSEGIVGGLANAVSNLENKIGDILTPLNNALTELANPVFTTIDADVTAAQTAFNNLNTALAGISEITTFPQRIEAQLNWAIGNAEEMLGLIQEKIDAINSGRESGDVNDYTALIATLEAELDDMRAIAAINITAAALDINTSTQAQLEAFILALNTLGGLSAFTTSIDAIVTAGNALPAGQEIIKGTTTNFKGIPFYMNQLNHLVRTFARAMNEGLNTDGNQIPGAIGHIYGFDANGENKNTMFFTYEDKTTGLLGVVVDENDPFRSLRLWIVPELDALGVPTGNLTTVSDPNPPANVVRDDMGRPMFTLNYDEFNALNFTVNPDILLDPKLLAASSNQNIGQANNDVILGFLAIGNDNVLFREGKLIDFIIATSNHLAVDNEQAHMFRESYEEVTMQTHNQRLSVSSVDTEEEMLNLVRFQNMFIATSKLINVIDTIYDTLINKLGNF